MEEALFRFSIVWFLLHIILFFIERYRYKHSNWSWYGFKHNGMLDITYAIIFIDKVGACIGTIMLIGYWIFQPIIN